MNKTSLLLYLLFLYSAWSNAAKIEHLSLHKVESISPFKVRLNYVGDQILLPEFEFFATDKLSGRLTLLQLKQVSDYMLEISHPSLNFNNHKLQLFRVKRTHLMNLAISDSQAKPVPQRQESKTSVPVKRCTLNVSRQQSLWRVSANYAKQVKRSVYTVLLATYYTNLDAFEGKKINALSKNELDCPGESYLSFFEDANQAQRMFNQLESGSPYNRVVDLNSLPSGSSPR